MARLEFSHSIVEYYGEQEGHRCGYCNSSDTSCSHGFWAHMLKVEDYQDLIDRGWRRSGQYCYKPIMNSTCCPMYTIRCSAKEFKLSKSQKRILKRFHSFLNDGTIKKDLKDIKLRKTDIVQSMDVTELSKLSKKAENDSTKMVLSSIDSSLINCDAQLNDNKVHQSNDTRNCDVVMKPAGSEINDKEIRKPLKAKQLRIARKREKLKGLGLSDEEVEKKMVEKKRMPVVKSVEDFINAPFTEKAAHNLEVRLVKSCPPSDGFHDSYETSFDLYKRYQMFVHKDPPEKLTHRQFQRFLCNSPLKARKIYGSYHQQYWLDKKLIAVGVIDVLPRCVSSVYFFYDPEYAYLSLGTYGALREVAFTRSLTSQYPELLFYYMGFYIHTCPKMRYKAAVAPSYLLCPEVYTWHPVKDCISKLDLDKYSRFNEDPNAKDENSEVTLSEVSVLYNRTAMPFSIYAKQKRCSSSEREEIAEYATLVGMVCARRMLLYRS